MLDELKKNITEACGREILKFVLGNGSLRDGFRNELERKGVAINL